MQDRVVIPVTDDDIRAAVSKNAFAAGRAYADEGRVLSIEVLDDATVQG